MNRHEQTIGAAYHAYRAGDYDRARGLLAGLDDPRALHLLGLVEKGRGDLDSAARCLERAAAGAPNDPDLALSIGQVERARGRSAEAEGAFRRALELRPAFTQAALGLGRVLIDGRQFRQARTTYEALLEASPDSLPAAYGLATAQLELGEAEAAEAMFDRLVRAGNDRPEIRFMRARARLETGRTEDALDDLNVSYRAAPTEYSLKTLAGTLWMAGHRDAFHAVTEGAAAHAALAVTAAELLRQSGAPGKALGVLERTSAEVRDSAAAHSVAALSYIDAGDAAGAESAARRCLAKNPDDRAGTAALITALLMQGKADDALAAVSAMRDAEPLRQHWIAYEADALRLLGDPRHETLADPDRYIRVYTLPVPEGYETLSAFNEALKAALERWHVYRTHPLDQSLRQGSQTPRDLTAIDDPVIRAYVRALDTPIRQYMTDVGREPDHPLTARNTGEYEIAGCWSVRLSAGGRHVNHVHQEGWISSAYYVYVPEDIADDPDRGGWIKFGEPPFPTEPSSPPYRWLCPTAGQVVLFPSFCWHGTEPIADDVIRITAPFDVVPR